MYTISLNIAGNGGIVVPVGLGEDYDHVPDPYYEGSEGFELVLDMLEEACGGLLDYTERSL